MDIKNDGGFKVADRRMFNADGDLRERETEPVSSDRAIDVKETPAYIAGSSDEGEEVSFQSLILSLSTSALVQLGMAPNPETGSIDSDLSSAKQTIDILEILKQKTKGNLSTDESQLLEECIHDLKMSYVRIMQGDRSPIS